MKYQRGVFVKWEEGGKTGAKEGKK